MEIIRSIQAMHSFAETARSSGSSIALVPTMGFLHEGHVSLMRLGKARSDVLVVSIFVNPMQFGAGEDYKDYPRDWERDVQMIDSVGTDCIFAPDVTEMYPQGFQTSVHVAHMTKNLCGKSRPTHFDGVTTVVAKLFNCIKPHSAIFGQKDFQQLMVIKRMVHDLDFDIEIVGAPIVREPDGLAMSSRNTYLSAEQRIAALCLSQSLDAAHALFAAGERNSASLIEHVRKTISAEKLARIDYIKVCDVESIDDVTLITRDAVMALAVFFGRARLIDNIVLKV
jgi:pantoate--beta-alanine ligase